MASVRSELARGVAVACLVAMPLTPPGALAAVGQWSRLPTSGRATPISNPWMVLDESGGRLFIWADTIGISQALPPPDTVYSIALATGAWALPVGGTVYAGTRYGLHTIAYLHPMIDAPHDRFINLTSIAPEGGNSLTFARTRPLSGSPDWSWTPLGGTPPYARGSPGLANDRARDRIWLAGGYKHDCGACFDHWFGDLWALDLATDSWTQVWAPDPGCQTIPLEPMFFDAWNDRLLIVGARFQESSIPIACGTPSRAIWQMPLHAPYGWSALSVGPFVLPAGTFLFDPNRGRMLAVDLANGVVRANGLTADTTWATLPFGGTPPPPRRNAAVVLDTLGDRLLVFGGTSLDGTVTYSDVWQLSFDPTTAVTISLVSARVEADGVHLEWQSSALGATRARLERRVSNGGWQEIATVTPDGTGRLLHLDADVRAGDRYEYRVVWLEDSILRYGGEVSVEVPRPRTLTIAALAPGLAPGLTVRVSLPDSRPVRVECFDSSGRRALRRELTGLASGSHTLRLDEPEALGAGVWWVRIVQGSDRASTRAVLLR